MSQRGTLVAVRRRWLAALIAAAGIALWLPGVGRAAGTGYVRLNQIGYASGAPKRAFLMTPEPDSGVIFRVIDLATGATAFEAPIGADQGAWSSTFSHVYALDFDALTTPGSYRIEVSGPFPASSPSFRIGAPAALYGGAIANALSFYENERDG